MLQTIREETRRNQSSAFVPSSSNVGKFFCDGALRGQTISVGKAPRHGVVLAFVASPPNDLIVGRVQIHQDIVALPPRHSASCPRRAATSAARTFVLRGVDPRKFHRKVSPSRRPSEISEAFRRKHD